MHVQLPDVLFVGLNVLDHLKSVDVPELEQAFFETEDYVPATGKQSHRENIDRLQATSAGEVESLVLCREIDAPDLHRVEAGCEKHLVVVGHHTGANRLLVVLKVKHVLQFEFFLELVAQY